MEIINTINADWKEFAFLMDSSKGRDRDCNDWSTSPEKWSIHLLSENVYALLKKKQKTEATWGNLIGLLYDSGQTAEQAKDTLGLYEHTFQVSTLSSTQ